MAQSFNIDSKVLNEELLARGIVMPGLNLPQYENRYEKSLVRRAVNAPTGTSSTSTTYDRPTTVDRMDMVDVLDVYEGLEQDSNCDQEKTLNNEQCLEADLIELIKVPLHRFFDFTLLD